MERIERTQWVGEHEAWDHSTGGCMTGLTPLVFEGGLGARASRHQQGAVRGAHCEEQAVRGEV